MYDCLRANKSLAAWELKDVSVLDKEFMDVAMRINPQDKMINKEHPMEKWVVQALKICCRKCSLETKEQFSDGVGYGWIDKLKR
jgi:asparagine synthase (glutamine-hydrolysing)